jgi:plastocyanin
MTMRPLVVAMTAVAMATACCAQPEAEVRPVEAGGEATQPPAAGAAPAAPAKVDPRDGGLDVGFGEYAVTLEASAIRPGPVTFVVRNGGAEVHGFEMELEGGDSSGPGSGDDGFKIERPTFGPGETIRVRLDLAPGVYKIECFVANHDDLGMEALLEVRPDAPKVASEAPGGGGEAVAISGFAFEPSTLQVPAGTEVTWTNEDPAPHTDTSEDGSFDSGQLDQGATFSTTVDGTVTYVCQIHPTMRGTIEVV